jgi:hypothetical protein
MNAGRHIYGQNRAISVDYLKTAKINLTQGLRRGACRNHHAEKPNKHHRYRTTPHAQRVFKLAKEPRGAYFI